MLNVSFAPAIAGIPEVCQFSFAHDGAEWTLWYPDEYASLRAAVCTTLTPLLTFTSPSVRLCTVATVPLHVAILPKERAIRLASPNASRELFLIDQHAHDPAFVELLATSPELTARFRALQAHLVAIAAAHATQTASVWQEITQVQQLAPLDDTTAFHDIDARAATHTDALLRRMRAYRAPLVERGSNIALQLVSDLPVLRIHLLRLIAVLPSLEHDTHGREVARLARETLRRLLDDARAPEHALPAWLRVSLRIGARALQALPDRWSAALIRRAVRMMATRFIAGESIDTAAPFLTELYASGRDVTLDQLGELVVAEEEADRYCDGVLDIIRGYAKHIAPGKRNAAGILRAHISIKCSALTPEFTPHAPEYAYEKVAARLVKIFRAAQSAQVFINLDAEHYHYRDLTLYCLRRALLEHDDLRDWADVGIVVQAYLRDGSKHLDDVIALATARGVRMPVRLVKGAYWDAETIEAHAHNFPAAQFLNKEETDLHFRQLILRMLAAHAQIQLCVASHNVHDHAFAIAAREIRFPNAPVIEHECLHGTYEALSLALAVEKCAVRNYTPIGSLLVGMAYLVRRILENASQVGVLTIMRSHADGSAIEPPDVVHARKCSEHSLTIDPTNALANEFRNIAPMRLFCASQRELMNTAVQSARDTVGAARIPEHALHGEKHNVTSPSDPTLVVGTIPLATASDVETIITAAHDHAQTGAWPQLPVTIRAAILQRAAIMMTVERTQLAALIVLESGKSIIEAVSDVDEAIDFLNFYARCAATDARESASIPRGVAAVIAPWNFPLAIPCGMLSAPLAVGNTVILKPAEHTPLITHELVTLLHRAGVPRDAVIHLPGSGRVIGARMVEDPRVASIVFTGSKKVGMWIGHTAGQKMCTPPQAPHLRVPARVITEMGGKNAIIVTNNAELDETLTGVLQSAFTHAGQKCSAASRVIVDEHILEKFLARFVRACRDLHVAPAWDPATGMNPVISRGEQERLRTVARQASEEARAFGGRVLIDRTTDNLPGCCVGPCAILLPADRATHPDSFAMQEIFGPIVHIIPSRTLEHAVQIANATEYALTGGIFSQSQDEIDYVLARLQTGNIYVNRSITGARVAIEPFGGFKHSGTGPKAGSQQYVKAFTLPGDFRVAQQLRAASRIDSKTMVDEDSPSPTTFDDAIAALPARPNREIPGQLSYDDYTLTKRKGIVLALDDTPSPQAVRHLQTALIVGASLEIFATSKNGAVAWSRVSAHPRVKISHASQPTAHDLIGVDFLILDGNDAQIEECLRWVHGQTGIHDLITILTPFDVIALEQFVLVRSCAINTMRYGAAMTLDRTSGGSHGH